MKRNLKTSVWLGTFHNVLTQRVRIGVCICVFLVISGCTDDTHTQGVDPLEPLWVPCITDGFGNPDETRSSYGEMAEYKGYLYIGKNNSTVGGRDVDCRVYRIHHSTGCSAWEVVVGDGAKVPEGFGHGLYAHCGMIVFHDALYDVADCELWRTYDGIDWHEIIGVTGGYPPCFGVSWGLEFRPPEIFNDMLYLITATVDQITIWRSADGITWTCVVGPGALTPAGFGVDADDGYSIVFKGNLYVITFTHGIFRTADGIMWEKIADEIARFDRIYRKPVVFKDQIYLVSMKNIYRSSDAIHWERVLGPGGDFCFEDITVWNDHIYVGTNSIIQGSKIFRSNDGIKWKVVIKNGFYDSYADGRNWAISDMTPFNGQLFVGTAAGGVSGFHGEVWRSNFPGSSMHAPVLSRISLAGMSIIMMGGILLWVLRTKNH